MANDPYYLAQTKLDLATVAGFQSLADTNRKVQAYNQACSEFEAVTDAELEQRLSARLAEKSEIQEWNARVAARNIAKGKRA